jgi:glycine/D-amino acid oxidase-like deaminating enzyme
VILLRTAAPNTLREASQAGNWATACELFPPVSKQRLVRSWCSLQAQSLDDLPFIGSVSGLEGLTLALASWHGFALAPNRIAQFDPAHVAAFLAEPATSNVLE